MEGLIEKNKGKQGVNGVRFRFFHPCICYNSKL